MMKRLLLGTTAILLLITSASALTNTNRDTTATSSAITSTAPSGPAKGAWVLPRAGKRGALKGKLRSRSGRDVFEIRAFLDRDPTKPSGGMIKGKAEIVGGPLAGKKFLLVGKWHATSRGEGVFRARIVAPGRNGDAPKVIVKLRGSFRDDDPKAPRGKFVGKWIDVR